MIFSEGPRVISPFPSGLGVARPRSEPRLLCCSGEPVELDICLTNTGTGTCTNVIFTLRLPTGIARLHGRERIEVSRVLPGESKTSRLGIRAEEPGRYRLTSTNFSYRDHRGRPHRESGFDTEITVDPAPDPPPAPRIMVELQDAELPYGEWTIVRGRITNAGAVGVSDLEIRFSGQVTTDQRTARSTLEQLPPGRSVDVPFYVLARQAGANVPVHLDIAYHHQFRRQVRQTTQSIRVVRDRTIRSEAPSAGGRHLVKVLILTEHPLWALTTYELRDYRRQLERAIAFFAAQEPVPAGRDELQAKLDTVTAEQDSRSRLAGG